MSVSVRIFEYSSVAAPQRIFVGIVFVNLSGERVGSLVSHVVPQPFATVQDWSADADSQSSRRGVRCSMTKQFKTFIKKGTKDVKPTTKTQKKVFDKSKLRCVNVWDLLTKKVLKAYPDKNGSMLRSQSLSTKQFFKVESLRDLISEENSELVARPPMGMNLVCASVETGLDALIAFQVNNAVSGIPKVMDLFGVDVLSLVKAVQVESGTEKNDMKKATKQLLEIAGDKDPVDEKLKALAQLADFTSRVRGFAVEWHRFAHSLRKMRRGRRRSPARSISTTPSRCG